MNRRPTYPLRLAGASLVEVLVAMSLVSVIFVIGLMTWLQLNGTQAPYRILDHRLQAREMLLELEAGGISEVVKRGGVSFVKSVEPLAPGTGLLHLQVTCLSASGEELFQRHRIVHRHEN